MPAAPGQLHELLEAMPDAIVMVDGQGKIAFANRQAEKVFRQGRQALVGQPVEMLLPERFRDTHANHRDGFFRQPRTRGMGAGLELFGRRGDGEEFPVEISLSPVATETGTMVLSAIRDVTERKRVEASLQQASRMKSQFLANMSHELRTPLNGIIGFSELLVDGKAGALVPRQLAFLQDILNSGRHLLHLVNDLLDISKIEAGRMDVNAEAFSLPDCIEECCATLATAVADKRIGLQRSIAPDLSVVCLDRPKFKQVLLNLLSNAVKFTDAGGHVAIVLTRAPGELVLSVRDTGIGIDPDELSGLFVEFQRASGEARRRPGTGLGLALTRRLVELQGGRIEAQSEVGRGSTFVVHLPLQEGG